MGRVESRPVFVQPFISRRREPRVSVGPYLSVGAVSPDGPTILSFRDVCHRGMAIETTTPVEPGFRCDFQFHGPSGLLFTAIAVAIHCYRKHGQPERWISGWEFPEQEGLDAAIEQLIDEAAGSLSIE